MNPKRAQLLRYFLHGDESVDCAGHYYCSCCDVFAEPAHFNQHTPERHSRALACSINALRALERDAGRSLRPPNARSLSGLPMPLPAKRTSARELLGRWGYRWGENAQPRG